jgi:hypothetical protein
VETTERLVIWSGLDARRWEVAHFTLQGEGVAATGTQIGIDPLPYRLDYQLDARDGFVTRRLEVQAQGEGWSRRLVLQHDGNGDWTHDVDVNGASDFDAAGAEPEVIGRLTEARDCDLGLSPVTNLMPIRRYKLHETYGNADIVAAWVSVPDLRVYAYRQRYEFVRRGAKGSVVRFVDRGLSAGFTAELELDPDGLIEVYPQLARRVE